MTARVAVLLLPGVNGEEEAARACRAVGLAADLVPWTTGSRALASYDAYLLPGGFSYQDRVRAGAVGARHEWLEVMRRRADQGAPVLGICNGAQVLVESGLVPGGKTPQLALAPNRMPDREGYHARWIWCRVGDSPCLFTQAYAPGELVPMPVAHGEGRFFTATPERWEAWRTAGQLPLVYARPAAAGGAENLGSTGTPFPWNPNGAQCDAAGVCNARGNVLALMPHPERGESLSQVPLDLPGPWGERRRSVSDGASLVRAAGPGRGLFLSLAQALGAANEHAATSGAQR
jgi:phosphoribosylformylglycinamidine synthase I